jgi:hypothetical protein
MFQIEAAMVQFDPKLRLPTVLELPDSDETPVDIPGLFEDTPKLIPSAQYPMRKNNAKRYGSSKSSSYP